MSGLIRSTTFILAACATSLIAVSSAAETFAKKAAQGGLGEVRLGQLAASKAQSPKVREFGQRMFDDHSKANSELSSLLVAKNITAPSDLNAKDNQLLTRLSEMSGDRFDKTYMSAMVKDHEEDISEFEKEANSGSDAELKSFATRTLPTLREHLRMAKAAATAVGTH